MRVTRSTCRSTCFPRGSRSRTTSTAPRTFSGTTSDAPGTVTVTVTASDGELSATGTIDLVIGANLPPTIDTPLADDSVNETNVFSVSAAATDPEGQTLGYTFGGDVPAGMTIDASGQISWTPGLADSGVYQIDVVVSDGFNSPTTDSFVLEVGQTDPMAVRSSG